MKNLKKKIPISIGVVVIVISAVVVFAGVFVFRLKPALVVNVVTNQNQAKTSTIQIVDATTTDPLSSLVNITPAGATTTSIAKKVLEIYSDNKYSNGKEATCLSSYLNSLNSAARFDLVKSCPVLTGVDFSNPYFTATGDGVMHFLTISELMRPCWINRIFWVDLIKLVLD